ncbi:DUF4400 domain-containing protein [Legionella fairfieldensis]|uniref:DUF4400 domain-containing protein n=1 Tax=Legionella fairfieldensis TaxID=45064 RepID=UPI0006849F95|nr:DUF4400 domain-containing protein [Legionella fairfieldensis]
MSRTDSLRATQSGLIKRAFTALFIAVCSGFLVLFSWGLFLWGTSSFDRALQALERLSLAQAALLADSTYRTGLIERSWLAGINQSWERLLHEAKSQSLSLQKAIDWPALDSLFSPQSTPFLSDVLQDVQSFFLKLYGLFLACAHTLWLKSLICLSAIPLFLLTALAGLVDGLNQRAIRTASLGRESTYMFHKSLPVARKTLFWIVMLWLALPVQFNPALLFLGLSVSLAWVMSISASRFKKYL